MKHLLGLFRIASQASRVSTSLLNYVPQRGARYETKINWKKPVKYVHYHPLRTGDGVAGTETNPDEIYYLFRDAEELGDADGKVKKIFSLVYQKHSNIYQHYKDKLIEKVREHPLDTSSRNVKIAALTARIRYNHNRLNVLSGKKKRRLSKVTDALIGRRRAHLRKLRGEDYKKFEWILEVLNLEFKPGIRKGCLKLNRRKSILTLATLNAEKLRQEKLAELKKAYDEKKVPFLMQKLEKLQKIKEMEEKYELEPSVTEEDFKECLEKLERVKIEVEENVKNGYLKKVHPYFLEPYHEKLLREKEKTGELLREQIKPKEPKKYSQDTSDL